MSKFKRLHKLSILPVTYKFEKNHSVTVYLMELDPHALVFNFSFHEKKPTRSLLYQELYVDYKESFDKVLDMLYDYMSVECAKELLQHLNWEEIA